MDSDNIYPLEAQFPKHSAWSLRHLRTALQLSPVSASAYECCSSCLEHIGGGGGWGAWWSRGRLPLHLISHADASVRHPEAFSLRLGIQPRPYGVHASSQCSTDLPINKMKAKSTWARSQQRITEVRWCKQTNRWDWKRSRHRAVSGCVAGRKAENDCARLKQTPGLSKTN